ALHQASSSSSPARVGDVVVIAGIRDRRQDRDDQHRDHYFDQSKAMLAATGRDNPSSNPVVTRTDATSVHGLLLYFLSPGNSASKPRIQSVDRLCFTGGTTNCGEFPQEVRQ